MKYNNKTNSTDIKFTGFKKKYFTVIDKKWIKINCELEKLLWNRNVYKNLIKNNT